MRISDWSSDVCSSDLMSSQRRREQQGSGDQCAHGYLRLVVMRLAQGLQSLHDVSQGHGFLRFDAAEAQRHGLFFGFLATDDDDYRHLVHRVFADLVVDLLVAQIGVGTHVGTFQQRADRSEEHTSELQSLMRISYAVFCLKKKK